MARRVRVDVERFFNRDRAGRVLPRRALSCSLCFPLFEIADRFRKRGGRDEPLLASRAWHFYGVEHRRLAVADDLAMRAGHTGCHKRGTHVMHGQGVTELATVELRRAMAGCVLHSRSVASDRGCNGRYPHLVVPKRNRAPRRGLERHALGSRRYQYVNLRVPTTRSSHWKSRDDCRSCRVRRCSYPSSAHRATSSCRDRRSRQRSSRCSCRYHCRS